MFGPGIRWIEFDTFIGLADQIISLTCSAIGTALCVSPIVKHVPQIRGDAVADSIDRRLGIAAVTIHLALGVLAFWPALH